MSKLDKASFREGLGKIYPYLDNSLKRDIVSRLCTQSDFSRGVREGLGKIYHYLKRELQIEIYMIAKKEVTNEQYNITCFLFSPDHYIQPTIVIVAFYYAWDAYNSLR